VVDLDQLRQGLLLLLHVDEGVEVVAEDAEVAIHAHVDARRLQERRLVGIDLDAALAEQARDRAVRQDHAADSRTSLSYADRVATTRTIELKTEIPGPRSRAIVERQDRVVASPLALTFPVVVESARGVTLTDVDGNTFIDFAGGVGTLNV